MASLHCFSCGKQILSSSSFFSAEKRRKVVQLEQRNWSTDARLLSSHGHDRVLVKNNQNNKNNNNNSCSFPLSFDKTRNSTLSAPLYVSRQLRSSNFFQLYSVSQNNPFCYRRTNVIKKALVSGKIIRSQRSSELGDRIVSVPQPYIGHSNLSSTYAGNDDDDPWYAQKATSTRGSNDDDTWQSMEEAHRVEERESIYPRSDDYGQGPGTASSLEKKDPTKTDESSSDNSPVFGIKEDWRMAGLAMRKAAARSTNIADEGSLEESALARVTPSAISNRWNGIMLLNFLAVLYGSNAVAMKFTEAAAVSPPASLACTIKFGAAALAFSPALVETFNRRLSKEDKGMIFAGLELALWLMAGIITQTVGLGGASASNNASLLLVFTVVLVPVLEIFTGRRRISKLTWLATLAALSGMVFLKESGQWDLNLVLPKVEDLMGILSGTFFGIQIFRAEMLCSRFDPLKLTAVQLVFMFLVSMAWEGWTLGSLEQFQQLEGILPQLPWGPLLYSGLLAGGVGAWVELNGLRNVHASTATLIYTTIPVWGGFMTSLVTGKGGLPSLQEVLAGSAILVGATVFALVTAPEPKGQIKEEEKLVEKDDLDLQSEGVVQQASESVHLPVPSMERKISDAGVPLWGTPESANATVNGNASVAGERLQGKVEEEKLAGFSGACLNLSNGNELIVEERHSFMAYDEGTYTNHQKVNQDDGQLNELQEEEDKKQGEDEKKEDGPNPDTLPSAFLQTQLKFPFYATQAQEFLAKARGVGEGINTGLASAKAGGATVGAGAKVAGSTAAAAGSSGQAVAGQVAAGQAVAGAGGIAAPAVGGAAVSSAATAGAGAGGAAVAGGTAAAGAGGAAAAGAGGAAAAGAGGAAAAGAGGAAAAGAGGAATVGGTAAAGGTAAVGGAAAVGGGAAAGGAAAGGAAAGGAAAGGAAAGGAAAGGGVATAGAAAGGAAGGAVGSTVGTAAASGAAASGAAIGGASAGGVAASGAGAGVGAGLVGAGGVGAGGAGVGSAAGGAAHIAATGAGVGGGAAGAVGAVTSSAGSLVTGVAGTLNVAGEAVLGSVQAVGGGALQATSGVVQGITAPLSQTAGAVLQTAATVAPGPTAAVATAVSSATTAVSSATTAVSSATTAVSSVTSMTGAALQTAVTAAGNALPPVSAVANATGVAISAVAPVASTATIGLQTSVASMSPAASGALQAVSTVIAAEPSIPAAVTAFQSASSSIPSNIASAAANILPVIVGGGGGATGAVQAITSVAVAAGAGAGAVVGSGVGNVNVSSTLQKVASGVGAVGAEASSVASSMCQATVPAIESLMNAVKPAASFSADRVSKAIESLPPSATEVMSLLSQRARNVADVLTPVSNSEVLNNMSLSSQQLVVLERTAICPLELGFLPAVDGGTAVNQIAVDIQTFGASAVDYIGAACFAAAPLDVHEPPPSEMEAYFERVTSFLLSMQELSGTAVEETDRRADAVTSVVMQVQPVLDSLLQSQPWLKHFSPNTGGQCRLDTVDFMQSDFAQSVVVQSQPFIEHLSHAVTSHADTLALLHFLQTFF